MIKCKVKGLSLPEVAERQEQGLSNRIPYESSRSIKDILRGNILTPFNALITVLAVVVVLVNRSPINSLFFLAMLLNMVVGIAQELHAKRILDKLAILVKPKVTVIRDGAKCEIRASDIVVDDIICIGLGDQIVVDGAIVESSSLEVDESLLTGESDAIAKSRGNQVLSGSLVVAGSGLIRATKVGESSYSYKLASEAKQFQRASSELIASTNKLLKWISWLLVIVVPILVIGQIRLSGSDWQNAVIHTVAAIVGMIPEGLVLLTSAAFMLATVNLARQHVLIQQLPAVETLARVNTLLLDKTGTITAGTMQFERLIVLNDAASQRNVLPSIIATFASRASSPTNDALSRYYKKEKLCNFTSEVAFSSARKWSGLTIDDKSYVLGAPEVLLSEASNMVLRRATELATNGKRVLVLCKSRRPVKSDQIAPSRLTPIALLVLAEKVRDDAAATLKFFVDQGVDIKIISGDSPTTVKAIAERVGLTAVAYDARQLPDPTVSEKAKLEFLSIVKNHNVFGRVRPEQKRQIASALQDDGSVVAMTGDGVNDALALKKADLGIAMSSGSAATRAVAEVVLLDNKFSHLPSVLAEGRRVTANIERASNLFIIKNVYSLVLALTTTSLGLTYPFLPAQMTIIGALSIGIPAFFLALAPNKQVYRPGFLSRVLRFAIPTGIIEALAMLATYYAIHANGVSLSVASTGVSIVVMLIGMAILTLLSRPVKGWKILLIGFCSLVFAGLLLWQPIATRLQYELDLSVLPTVMIASIVGVVLVTVTFCVSRHSVKHQT